jgi:hypothetical protein
MENKDRINSILSDIKELEGLLENVLKEELYPIAFFSRSFDLAHHLLKDLHILEGEQIESLRKQMEEYRQMIDAVSVTPPEADILIEVSMQSPPPTEAAPTPKEVAPRPAETLNDVIGKKNISDLRNAFSLIEKYYFQKALFNGSESVMYKAISDLNEIYSYEESLVYIREQLKWDETNTIVVEFLNLLEKRFR